jgi:GDP-L-fucose synthase
MNKDDKIYVAGHKGLVGSALVRRLKEDGFKNIITRTSSELNLEDQAAVKAFFETEKPDCVFLCAGKAGGIIANKERPADFIYPNLLIECNVISSAWNVKVKKLLFLACSIIYPKECKQPIKEEYLLTGKPEPSNTAHTTAKIAGVVLCQSYNKQYSTGFISCVASNTFGINDNFDPTGGHVIPALINKFHTAKIKNDPHVTIWGTGKPRRDFIYVDNLADACMFLMENYSSSDIINIGPGNDMPVSELANLIKEIVGYKGEIKFDTTKPDGMPRKYLDNSKLSSLGWKCKINIREGLSRTYSWYLTQTRI